MMSMSREVRECLENLGYVELTNLQKKVFSKILGTRNSIIVVAPTGSGKTEASLFPIMYMIHSKKIKPIATIYITPLRALNRDLEERLIKIAKCFDIKIALRHGDTPQSLRTAIEKDPPHVLLTTPESLNYIVINSNLRNYLSNLEFIVIDEFRDLIDSKRGYQLFTIIYLLEKRILKKRIRKIALTATLKNELLAQSILNTSVLINDVSVLRDRNIKRIEIEVVTPHSDYSKQYGVEKYIHDRDFASKIAFLIDILRNHRGVLVFTNTRSLAEKLGYVLSELTSVIGLKDIKIGVHHGSLNRMLRTSVEKDFKTGLLKGLIATSSMELGIDIGRVDYVVQYGSPRQVTRLLQRIGRSGHKLGDVSRGCIIVGNNMFQILESTVLKRRAINYQLEVERKYSSPLDVLAYSIAVYVLVNNNGVDIYELYSDLINYELYRELDIATYLDLLNYLNYARIVRINNNKIYPTKKTRLYVYRVNMIPDTRNIDVIQTYNGEKIGVLNEEYVVLNIKEGDTIVLGGVLWRVIGYDSDEAKLYVEQTSLSREILIPHWEGEDIPVEYKIAREVGSIIRRLKKNISIREYGLPENVVLELSKYSDLFGDDETIVIDYCSEYNTLFINVFGGSRVNKLLRDLIKTIIMNRYPFLNIRAYSTPYAVLIEFRKKVSETDLENIVDLVEKTIRNISDYLANIDFLKTVATDNGPLLWRIYQVAQRFGAIDPESSRISRSILQGFVDTVIGLEAFKEVVHKDYDIDSAREIGELVRKGLIKIVRRISPIINRYHYEILQYFEIPNIEVIKPFDRNYYSEKILNRKVILLCINCGYYREGRIRDFLGMSFNCPECKYRSLTVVKSKNLVEREIVLKHSRNQKLNKSEKKILEDLRNKAILLSEHGDLALIILGSRGVSYNDAKTIISRVRNGGDLYEILYEYEKKVIKAKKFFEKKKRLKNN